MVKKQNKDITKRPISKGLKLRTNELENSENFLVFLSQWSISFKIQVLVRMSIVVP